MDQSKVNNSCCTHKEIDPVCKMEVDPHTTRLQYSLKNKTYYFCNPRCLEKFTLNPEKYLSPSPAKPLVPNDSRIYTCPMHPEIEQRGPGSCPLCGMALEPKDISLHEEQNPELKDFTKRLKISTILTLPVFLLAMSDILPGQPVQGLLPPWLFMGLQFLLATPVVLWGGWPFFERGWLSIKTRKLNMFTLIAVGTGVAYIYSTVATFFPQLFPENLKTHHGMLAVYFEASAVIVTLVLVGQVLELRARQQTGTAIRSLLNLAPKRAHKINKDGSEEEISLEALKVGDLLRVKPGEKIPTDGVLVEGQSFVDESMISGESEPVQKQSGSGLTGATINGTGSFTMQVTKVGENTLLAQIIKMVSQAQRSKAPIQKLADDVSSYFVPAVIFIAVVTAFMWLSFGPQPALTYAIVNSVAVLIIACPCALGLATPMSIMVGTGKGASMGILIKNAESLEVMEKITTLVVDKTGTLTTGKPRVTKMQSYGVVSQDELLQLCSSLENLSEHPLAQAILEEAKSRNIELLPVENFKSYTGMGISGLANNKEVLIGNKKLLEKFQIQIPESKNGLFIIVDSKLAGIILVEDPIKPTAQKAIAFFHSKKIKVAMLTGDHIHTAQKVASALGIDHFEAELLPEQKIAAIKKLQQAGEVVAMAGDGINDAPALAQAHIGIAMGTGTDVAIESAGITLVKGDLSGIVKAYQLSRATMKNIRQNLFFAFIYNVLGVPIAAGILYPFLQMLLSPMLASLAMSLSSVSVIANALRLRSLFRT